MTVFLFPLVLFFSDIWRWSTALLSRWRIWLWQCDSHSQVHCWRDSNHPRAGQAKDDGYQYRILWTPWLSQYMSLCSVLFCLYSTNIKIKHTSADFLRRNVYICILLSLLFITRPERDQGWRYHFRFWIRICSLLGPVTGWEGGTGKWGQELRTAESAFNEGTVQGHVCVVLKTGNRTHLIRGSRQLPVSNIIIINRITYICRSLVLCVQRWWYLSVWLLRD